jgi:amidase
MAAEAHRFIGPLVAHARDLISERLLALLDEGAAISTADYDRAIEAQAAVKLVWAGLIGAADALLTLPVLGEAPDLATTGDPRCCTRWTLAGAPAMSLPVGFGPSGLPLGVQLVGAPGGDDALLSTALWMEPVLRQHSRLPLPR